MQGQGKVRPGTKTSERHDCPWRAASERRIIVFVLNRRRFLATSLAVIPAVRSLPLWAKTSTPIGVQLYTLRAMAEKDLPSVLREIRAIGYQQVELVPLAYSRPAGELRKLIADCGLTAPSGHFGYQELPQRFTYAKELGLKWMICPIIPKELWSADGFHQVAKQFNDWGKQARDLGMGFAFHNHDYEFAQYGGTTGMDILREQTAPELVSFELDCYWVAQAGLDPLHLLRQMGKRVRLLHLKDRKPGFPPSNDMGPNSAHFTEVGNGTIDWRPIIAEAERLKVEYYFVEQDKTDGPPLESIRASYNYLQKLFS
jgi:sugar phosphate isomerase/epimerase